jgi:predicted dehydrogenase
MTPSRRTFLGASAGLALASSAVARRDDEEPVPVAVIGTGGRGSDLIRALSTIDAAEIAGVCDDYPPHLEQGAKFAGPKARTFTDYRQMLDKLKPRAVVVAVPLHLHFPIASACLAAGCDVFLEKTMCHTIEEAKQLAKQIAATKRVFQVGLQRRSNPVYKQAQAMIETGMIGQVTAIQAQWHRHNAWRRPIPVPRSHPDWPALERRLNWRLYKASSGGLMAELGSHQLDVVNWLLGTPPKRVMATGGIDFWRDGREVFDNVFCTYEYELQPPAKRGGKPYTVRATYSSVCNNAYQGAAELILGTRGSLYLTSGKGLLYQEAGADKVNWAASKDRPGADTAAAVVTAGKTLKLSNDPWAHRGKPIEIDIEQGNDTRDELISFLDHVRRGDPRTVADAKVALEDCATVMMANRAAERGGWVDYPLH